MTKAATPTGDATNVVQRTAHLDELHVGHINGAMGTIAHGDVAPRDGWRKKLVTLLAVVGPGLIVMVGDNDAGAFGTYGQAGQNYGTTLLWSLLLLIPVLYVNQEMVLRLGAVCGVGHARLILERFGKFWGAFSVIDLFILNALTIVVDFIGVSLAASYLGLPKLPMVLVSAVAVIALVSTGSFRTFERIALATVAGSLLLVPMVVLVHPPVGQIAHGMLVPGLPAGANISDVLLLLIAIVGTTVAPWQLFFQQSYVIDKRLTPRFIKYERADLRIGVFIVIIGALAIMSASAMAFAGRPGFAQFTDAAGIAAGIGAVSHAAGVIFAIALLDCALLGATAVGLASSYALADVLSLKHSLHRPVHKAPAFYATYAALIAVAAALVVIPGVPLGLLTQGVQVLAGVLLPSATVFLLLLCNDKAVLGPWVNGTKLNVFTGMVVWVLVLLSIILTASVLFPDIAPAAILGILGGGAGVGAGLGILVAVRSRRQKIQRRLAVAAGLIDASEPAAQPSEADRKTWRMPPLSELARPDLSSLRIAGLAVLRGYLLLASVLVIVKIVQLSLGQ